VHMLLEYKLNLSKVYETVCFKVSKGGSSRKYVYIVDLISPVGQVMAVIL